MNLNRLTACTAVEQFAGRSRFVAAWNGAEHVGFRERMARSMESCVFCDIVADKVPASVVHRDGRCIAFMDIQPVTPGHLLVVPLAHSAYLADLDAVVGGHLFVVAQKLAAAIRRSRLRADGVTLFLADGEAAGQEVFHVHLHVFPRFEGDGFGLRFAPEYGQPVARERLDAEAMSIATASGTA